MSVLSKTLLIYSRIESKYYRLCVKVVCYCHVKYAFQSESSLYSCLSVKELLAQNRRNI